jgi:hypothetical protein
VPLPELLAAGAVRRWHTQAVRHEQTVAAHSWGVALIALRLAGAEAPAEGRAQLLLLGLLHDAHEGTFGDTPYRAKALLRSQGIDLDGRCAEAFWGPGGLDGAFAPWVRNLVAVADQLEAVAFASQNAPELAPLVALRRAWPGGPAGPRQGLPDPALAALTVPACSRLPVLLAIPSPAPECP